MLRRTLLNLIPVGVAAAVGIRPAKAEYVHGFEVVRIKADLMTVTPYSIAHSFLGVTDCWAELVRDGISVIKIPVYDRRVSDEEAFNHPLTIEYLPENKNNKIYVISCGDKVNYLFSESKLKGLTRQEMREQGLNTSPYVCTDNSVEAIWHQEAKRWA